MRSPGLLALCVLVACGSEPKETGDTSAPVTDTDTPVVAPTFTEVRDEILVPTCGIAGCHAGGEGGLTIVSSLTVEDLVEVPSTGAPGERLVVPFDADGSYLVKKVVGAPDIVGDAMPPPFGGLPFDDIERIRAWIDAGALDD